MANGFPINAIDELSVDTEDRFLPAVVAAYRNTS